MSLTKLSLAGDNLIIPGILAGDGKTANLFYSVYLLVASLAELLIGVERLYGDMVQVCASKVYTSAEFKREKDNFQSLCKNLERAETKK
jgi:hypothetical protein